jgi:hypothetical protein
MRSRRIAVYILFFTLILAVTADAWSPPVENWSTSFAGRYPEDNYNVGYSLQHTGDGNYILIGEMGRQKGTSDIWLMNLDPAGAVLWEKTFGSQATDDKGYEVAVTGDGGFVLAGNTRNVNTPSLDVILIRTDKDGGTLWERTYRKGELNNLSSMKTTADGGYIFAGATDDQAWIVKLDETGVVLWENVYDYYVRASDVIQTGDGGYLVGIIRKDRFYLVQKLDGSGTVQWETRLNQKQVSAPLTDATLLQAEDNGYLVSLNSAIDSRLYPYLVKLDERGGIVWEKQVGTEQVYSRSTALVQTSDGGYVLLCRVLCKTDKEGSTEWVFNRSSGVPYSVQEASDGGFMLTGYRTRTSTTDLWVSKLSRAKPGAPLVTPGPEVTPVQAAVSPQVPALPTAETTAMAVEPVPPQTPWPEATFPPTPRETPPLGSPLPIFTTIMALSVFICIRGIKLR